MIKLTDLINEDRKNSYEYGCVMLYATFPNKIMEIQRMINPKDLHENGIEDEAHCTLLYGLHDGVTVEQVQNIINKHNFCDVKATGPTLFENPEFDVLKFDVGYATRCGAFLHKCNQALQQFPNTQTYPDYHPHMTIAYLKPGMGQKYVDLFKNNNLSEFVCTPTHVVFSEPNGTKTNLRIND